MKNTTYEVIAIEKLTPDPKQPRQHIDDEAVKEMAISIQNEGLINPIEIDEDFVIVTGELRLKAAKIAGLTEVPVKILENLSLKNRHIRQMQENLHHNSMSAYDTAVGLNNVRISLPGTAIGDKKEKGGYRHGTQGIKELHELFGMPETTISEFLSLLKAKGPLMEALKDPSFQRTKVAAIKKAPKKYQKEFEQLIATQKNIPRDTVRLIVKALRRADKYGQDANAEILLNENFEGLSVIDAAAKINGIVPDKASKTKKTTDVDKLISEKAIDLVELLNKHPLGRFDDYHRPLVRERLMTLGICLEKYFKGTGNDLAITQSRLVDVHELSAS